MISLKRGTVKLQPYDPKWQKIFEKEKNYYLTLLEIRSLPFSILEVPQFQGLLKSQSSIYHLVYSDSKMWGKLTSILRKLGYKFDRKLQHRQFFAKGPNSKRTHYLHVMRYNGAKWKSDRLFREYLRSHPKRLHTYANLKKELASQFPAERQKYSDGKDAFIKETLKLASKSKF